MLPQPMTPTRVFDDLAMMGAILLWREIVSQRSGSVNAPEAALIYG
jgi:hypothetical protein